VKIFLAFHEGDAFAHVVRAMMAWAAERGLPSEGGVDILQVMAVHFENLPTIGFIIPAMFWA